MMQDSKTDTPSNIRLHVTVGIIFVVLLGGSIFWKSYNKIALQEKLVEVSWSQVDRNIHSKNTLLADLKKVIEYHTGDEAELLSELDALRDKSDEIMNRYDTMPNSNQLNNINYIQKYINETTSKVLVVAKSHSNLYKSKEFLKVAMQIKKVQHSIDLSKIQFNHNVEKYNSYVNTTSANVLAMSGKFDFQEKIYFKNSNRAYEVFALK